MPWPTRRTRPFSPRRGPGTRARYPLRPLPPPDFILSQHPFSPSPPVLPSAHPPQDELLKSLPAAERVKVDAFVTENVLRAHAIPLDDSKLLANKVRERQDQLRAEREKKAGGDVKEEKKAETPVAAPAPANKEKAPVKFF